MKARIALLPRFNLRMLVGVVVVAQVTHDRKSTTFLGFLDDLTTRYQGQRLCVVMDNLNTHTNKAAMEWMERHPLVSFHFTPTHASWVNLVECFFSILTHTGLQQQVHHSGKALERFLKSFIETYHRSCGPFTWTKGPEKLYKIIQLTQLTQEAGFA